MSAFYVGQRVRIVRARLRPDWIGSEARVIAPDVPGIDIDGKPYAGDMIDRVNSLGNQVVCKKGELEPILPEGAAPSEFTTLADLLTSLSVWAPA